MSDFTIGILFGFFLTVVAEVAAVVIVCLKFDKTRKK